MREWMAERVAAAGEVVVKAANRAYYGLKTVVSAIRRRTAVKAQPYPQVMELGGIENHEAYGHADVIAAPPADFDTRKVRAMILRGERPPTTWRPFIKELIFVGERDFHDLSALSGLSALTWLSFGGTQVSNISVLSELRALRRLSLNGTEVYDLSALSGLSALKALSLDNTDVNDLSALSGLSALEELYLDNTPVSNLSALSGLSALVSLSLKNTQVRDLSAVAVLSGLKELYLDNTQVSDLSALSGLSALERLYLGENQHLDVSVLAHLEHLTILVDRAPLAKADLGWNR
jgi:hypothetical protein